MMRRTHASGRSRFWAVVPTVVVGLSWPGLWLLWPSVSGVETERVSAMRTMASDAIPDDAMAYRAPNLFGPPSHVGFSRADEGPRRGTVPPHPNEPPPRILKRGDIVAPSGIHENGTWPLVPSDTMANEPYTPRFPRRAVLPYVQGTFSLRVAADGALARRGFDVRGTAADWNLPTNAAWHVLAHVTVDMAGKVKHVFIEGGTEDESLRRNVERMLYRGVAQAAETPLSGPVRAAWTEGFPPKSAARSGKGK